MQADPDVPTSLGLDTWLAKLAEPNGAPGGGSAAGVMMGLAAALLHMVCGYTPDEPAAAAAAERVAVLRERALAASYEDGVRSVALGAALAAEGPERSIRLHREAVAASASSAELAEIGMALAAELRVVAEVGNPHLVADTGVASEALAAGLGAALINLRANVRLARKHAPDEDENHDDPLAAVDRVGERGRRVRGDVDALRVSVSGD
ncbi:cyclodeaminase/cyclohydrolase family protein [Microbacterium sp. P06]|uniref:cyclodeaminase/cyclohydrolase family protein n=1 Tax=Microbacterium sp. P06 TaxID=3366949 RepID=UPI00374565EC